MKTSRRPLERLPKLTFVRAWSAIAYLFPGLHPDGLAGVARGLEVCYGTGVNWHEVMDERALEMDRVVARELRADPAKLDLVVAWIEKFLADPGFSIHGKDALVEWLELIRLRGLPGVLEALADESEEGRRMRQNSPFAVIMPQEERRRILDRYESRRTRPNPARVGG